MVKLIFHNCYHCYPFSNIVLLQSITFSLHAATESFDFSVRPKDAHPNSQPFPLGMPSRTSAWHTQCHHPLFLHISLVCLLETSEIFVMRDW